MGIRLSLNSVNKVPLAGFYGNFPITREGKYALIRQERRILRMEIGNRLKPHRPRANESSSRIRLRPGFIQELSTNSIYSSSQKSRSLNTAASIPISMALCRQILRERRYAAPFQRGIPFAGSVDSYVLFCPCKITRD